MSVGVRRELHCRRGVVAVVVGLREFAPVGRRATSWRDWRGPERFAEVRQGLTSRGRSHPGLLPLTNLRFEVSRLLPAGYSKSDVAAARRTRTRKLLPHPRHQLGPRFCVRCRVSGAFDSRRSSWWRLAPCLTALGLDRARA